MAKLQLALEHNNDDFGTREVLWDESGAYRFASTASGKATRRGAERRCARLGYRSRDPGPAIGPVMQQA
jgi:hypothetical protein